MSFIRRTNTFIVPEVRLFVCRNMTVYDGKCTVYSCSLQQESVLSITSSNYRQYNYGKWDKHGKTDQTQNCNSTKKRSETPNNSRISL